ncbi:MAG TPA: hypothetical protein PKK52_00435 [Syntrophorhabdus sp.]|nr:hypothetical protein [Syntrophorhabdus sp.]
MDSLLINLIGIGAHGGPASNASPKEDSGTEFNQKSFFEVLKAAISEGSSKTSFLNKLDEIGGSGESNLANVMSSISNMLLSMIPPAMVPSVPASETLDAGGQETSEMVEDAMDTGQEGLSSAGKQIKVKELCSLLEHANLSALQEGLSDEKPDTIDHETINRISAGIVKEGETETEEEQFMAFQEEMIKLLSFLKGKPELSGENNKSSAQGELGKAIVQSTPIINLQQTALKVDSNTDSAVTQAQNTPIISELPIEEMMEKNISFLQANVQNRGKFDQDDGKKLDNNRNNEGMDGIFEPDQAFAKTTVKQSFVTEYGLNEEKGRETKGEIHTLFLNAAKKYKEHVSETNESNAVSDSDMANMSPQKPIIEVSQSDQFRANILNIKDNNITFEKGSFTSFMTDRIEKIVEQYSNRGSQMDMVVRLKLDDKETLLIGLKHEGQKIIVDVKASNDSLVNLIQIHKDDIARHLEGKNIFTNIFVQPDGERNTSKQHDRENKKGERRQETRASFINILEATV